jgi:ribosomal protein L11 methyltransferase
VIVPSWLDYQPAPDEVVLHLDPGMAFGTGLHPTTRLCLRLLEQHTRPGQKMLDLGTGSGILAIAAARQGAAPVLALDNDPVAVDVAHTNARHNNVVPPIHTAHYPGASGELPAWLATLPPTLQPPYDLIAANIIAAVLIDFAADLRAILAPGGVLISSGIVADREDQVALTYAAAGLHQQSRQREGEWVALVHG